MKTTSGIMAGCLLAAGCSTSAPPASQAVSTTDAQSGKPKKAAQGWIAVNRNGATDKELGALLAEPAFQPVRELLASPRCTEPAPKGAPGRAAAAGPSFLASGARSAFDFPAEPTGTASATPPAAAQLRRDALDATSVDVSVPAAGFRSVKCVVFARQAEGDAPGQPGLLAVLAIEQKFDDGRYTDYFRFRPLYVRATNSIARTRGGAGARPAQIAVSFALVARQLVVNHEGAATFAELGSAAVTVAPVRLDGEAATCPMGATGASTASGICAGMSQPIPVPVARGTVSLSIGVSEAGNVGADIDQAAAEQEAVRAARGPAAVPPAFTSQNGKPR